MGVKNNVHKLYATLTFLGLSLLSVSGCNFHKIVSQLADHNIEGLQGHLDQKLLSLPVRLRY